MTDLGKLCRVDDLRAIWADEARDFTPWLAEQDNIAQLAAFLGLGEDGLEVEAVETLVGPYRADILCRDTGSGDWVLIENQLERSDHSHLGQVVTYAAGLDARVVVWIAKSVSAEHKAAIDWLNEVSGADGPSFFALEIELWRIGDSPVAPRFNMVARPNDWLRQATSAKRGIAQGETSDLNAKRRAYWTHVQDRIAQGAARFRAVKPQAQSWISHGIGRTNVAMNMAMSTRGGWAHAEIYLGGPHAKIWFDHLETQKDSIERAIGPLVWQRLPDRNDCRIHTPRLECDPADEQDWPRQHAWLVEQADRLWAGMRPFIAQLPRDPDPREDA